LNKHSFPRDRLVVLGLAFVFAVLLFQTYDKANRPQGYDLDAYLYASRALITGEDPYRDSAFPYIYPLFLALLVTPLLALPSVAVHLIWFLLNAAALLGSAWILAGLLATREKAILPFACLFVLLLDSIQNNFLNGQVNFIVLYLCLQFLRDYRDGRDSRAALALGAATAIKILPGILVLLLVLRGKHKTAAAAALWAIGFCLLPWFVVGNSLWDYYSTYANQFLVRAARERPATPIFFSLSQFLTYLVPALGQWSFLRIASALLVLSVISLKARIGLLRAFCLFLAAALVISPKSDTHHLVLLYPGATLLSVNWPKERGVVLFWIFYLLGSVWKDGPLAFASIVILMYLLTTSERTR
jgi:hypothetical protein